MTYTMRVPSDADLSDLLVRSEELIAVGGNWFLPSFFVESGLTRMEAEFLSTANPLVVKWLIQQVFTRGEKEWETHYP